MAHQAGSDPSPNEQQLHSRAHDLERWLWQLTLQSGPRQFSPDLFRVLQLATVVHLPPNVYAQSIRIASSHPLDRYLHVWCLVPGATEDEVWEERTLLRYYTPGFPDPQFTQARPGMDLHPAWWRDVSERLEALTHEPDGQSDAPSPGRSWQGVRLSSAPSAATARAGQRLQRPASVTAPLEQLFHEYLALREDAFARRDATYRRLYEAYLEARPQERDAFLAASEEATVETLRAWMANGCPTPSAPAEERESEPGAAAQEGVDAPWPLALALQRLQALAEERSQTLERLCEALDGHQVETERDASGTPHAVCARCGARLSSRSPDTRERWLLR